MRSLHIVPDNLSKELAAEVLREPALHPGISRFAASFPVIKIQVMDALTHHLSPLKTYI